MTQRRMLANCVTPSTSGYWAAYFDDECGVSEMLAKGLPDEPTIFSMAHELEHHLVDRSDGYTLRTNPQRRYC
jgi:Zn-dependent peptidase ImmA (M78 family)